MPSLKTYLSARLFPLVLTLAVGFSFAPLTPAADTTLVPAGATWKYLDNGADQGTAWRAPAFNDSTWSSGPAQLGYGDGDEATTLGFGPNSNSKYITTYFRHSFNVSNASLFNGLTLRLLRDCRRSLKSVEI